MKHSLMIGFVLGLAGLATADEVRLRNGGTLKGTAREESGNVVIDTELGTVTLAATEVEAILPDPLLPCQGFVSDQGCIPQTAAPSAKPEDSKKHARVQPKDGSPSPKQKQVQHPRLQPELSPGYAYFGIPPSVPRRGSQNHGYGGIGYALPSPVRGFYVTP
jgi:hypothetical protein